MQIRLVSGGQDFCVVEHGQVCAMLGGDLNVEIHQDDALLYARGLELNPIDAWRFHAVMNTHGFKADLEAVLSAMVEPAQSKARARLEYSRTYDRFDPLVDQLGSELNLTSVEIDDLWREAAAL